MSALAPMVSRQWSCSEIFEGFEHLQKDIDKFREEFGELSEEDAFADAKRMEACFGIFSHNL